VLITLLVVFLVCVGMGAMAISVLNRQPSVDVTPVVAVPAPPAAPESPRAPEPPKAPEPPEPRSDSAELSSGMEKFKYPNAKVTNTEKAIGNEIAEMITSDSVDTVSDFYKKQFGDPLVATTRSEGEAVVFQISDSPMTIITISKGPKSSDMTSIKVVRTQISIPKFN
jgi:hypothetical protein